MAAIERRAKKTKPATEAPISRDTWPAPPMSTTIASAPVALAPVSLESVTVHDTIPTPPPGPNDDVDDVEIPTLRGLDLERSVGEGDAGESQGDTNAGNEG